MRLLPQQKRMFGAMLAGNWSQTRRMLFSLAYIFNSSVFFFGCTNGSDFAGDTKTDKSENIGGTQNVAGQPHDQPDGGGNPPFEEPPSTASDDGQDDSPEDHPYYSDDGGDDDIGGDDGAIAVKLRNDLRIKTINSDRAGDNRIKVQYISAKGDGDWHEAKIGKVGTTITIPDICLKKGTTELRLRFLGKKEYKPGDINVGAYVVNGAEVQVTVDMNGCGIFGTCVEPEKDTTVSLYCPKYDLSIEGIN